MWNRKDYPTANDADEHGFILVRDHYGIEGICNWKEFCEDDLSWEWYYGWEPMPKSDTPQPIKLNWERSNMWNRYDYPTPNDTDESGDILILRSNGRKSIYNGQDFCDEKLLAKDIGWMPLPPSDNVEDEPIEPIRITIIRGDRSWTIENRGFTIEIHDSRDPMGQPAIHAVTTNTNMKAMIADAVLSILESEDEDEDWCECEGEGVVVNDTILQGFLDALRGNETASVPASKPKPWQKNRGK